MIISVTNQVYVFFYCIIGGLSVGLLFDIFRLSRKYLNTRDIITYAEDILFWILVGIIVLLTVFYSNNGQLRGFVFLGILLGTVFYFLIFSKIILKSLSYMMDFCIKLINSAINIIKIPIRIFVGTLKGPLNFFYKKLCALGRLINKGWKMIKFKIRGLKKAQKIIKEKI